MPDNEFVIFRMNAQTTCENVTLDYSFQSSVFAPYKVTPNPASSNLIVSVDEEKLSQKRIAKSSEQDIRELIITNKLGVVKMRNTYSKDTRSINLNVSNLQTDIYIIKVFNGKTWETFRFIKQ